MTREFPLVDLSKTPELPIWHKKGRVTRHVPTPSAPMRAALHPFPGKPRADMKLLIKRGLAYLDARKLASAGMPKPAKVKTG